MWFLVALAPAQELACTPVPVDGLEPALSALEAALAAGDEAQARPLLDAAKEKLRCLAVPAPRAALGQVAWAQAELEAEDSADAAWSWIWLARAVDAPVPPARIRDDHPLRAALTDPPEPPPLGGPTGVQLARPKKGEVLADGAPLTAPELTLSVAHLIQVFDQGQHHLGTWQIGAAFPPSLLIVEVSEGQRSRGDDVGAELPPAGWKPRKLNTEAAYKDWIRKHPDGPWLQDARDGLDDLAWAAAVAADTELAAKQYLHDFPTGLHVDEARFRVDDLAYRAVMAAPKRAAWEALLAASADGVYASEARQQIDMLDWEQARDADDAAAYAKYLAAHPQGSHAARARPLEEERALDEARAKGTDSALQRFLERFPDGAFVAEANAMLRGPPVRAITLDVRSPDPGLADRIRADLSAALAAREVPMSAPGPDVGVLRVDASTVPRGTITDLKATLELWVGELKRPVKSTPIASTMLPDADAGAALGELLVANLAGFERWVPAVRVEAARPVPAGTP